MDAELDIILRLLTALIIGILIGMERGWSGRKNREADRVGGIRTFSLIGLLGGVWAVMARDIGNWALVPVFAIIVAMAIGSYVMETQRNKDIGSTTVYAKMLTFALSSWAGLGYHLFALGTTVVVVAILGMKPWFHRDIQNSSRK